MIHKIHIPVMGICYTVDTPIRVAHFGITSVISLVDDGLLEEYRMAYGERLGVDVGSPQTTRIGRIRSYLDFVADEAARKFEWICGMRLARCVGDGAVPCSGAARVELNDKDRYFLMLPADSPLRAEYEQVCAKRGLARVAAEATLTAKMEPGEIQANIMVSLNHEEAALDAVRGFAASKVRGSLVLSAGVNLGVFEEIAKHSCFYRYTVEKRETAGMPLGNAAVPQKKIILKVSDYRSALIQSRYLAKKGLEVYEYRIESGVNCGGHAFLEAKKRMPEVLREFVEKKSELFTTTCCMIEKFSQSEAGQAAVELLLHRKNAAVENVASGMFAKIVPPSEPPRITAQGGLSSAEDVEAVLSLGADGVGVGTPFLLVPQATSADDETRRLLVAATSADVVLSHASPLGVPFMNLRTSTAAELCQKKMQRYFEEHSLDAAQEPSSQKLISQNAAAASADHLKPGFPCRQHYLCRSIPGFDHPVCKASREYVLHRLAEIDCEETAALKALLSEASLDASEKNALPIAAAEIASAANATSQENSIREKFNALRRETLSRECICRFLGNAGREEIRLRRPSMRYESKDVAAARGLCAAHQREPISVCPGPNIAYFNREYTLLEMMQHLYGTGPRLISADVPFAFELEARLLKTV